MNTFLRFDSFEEFFHKHSEHIPVQIYTHTTLYRFLYMHIYQQNLTKVILLKYSETK